MKTIGILGGMSWESTAVYYRRLNELTRERVGGNASAPIVLHSFNFRDIEELQHREDWDGLEAVLTEAARGLARAGAEILVIATNTMHLLADAVESAAGLPLLHIADAAGNWIRSAGHTGVLLLGTRFTMEKSFYRDRIQSTSGARTMVPVEEDQWAVHDIIYGELCGGVISDKSRTKVVEIINRYRNQGAQSVILGCTELPLLVHDGDAEIPVIDTMELHVRAVAAAAMADQD